MATGSFQILSSEQGSEIRLAMQRLWLTGHVLPVGARLLVRHVFRNGEDHNIEVVYSFMLPRDAALRRFDVRGEGFEAHSELKRVQEAVQQYEEGIEAGHLSALARSYQDDVVNLTLGNLKPGEEMTVTLEILAGVELRDDGLRFRFPFTLAPGYHAQARMIDVNGFGEIELPEETFGDVILPKYSRSSKDLHQVGFDLALRIPGAISMVGSPSHSVQMREEQGTRRVTLAVDSDLPNRDLVLDIRVAQPEVAVLSGGGSFAMVVPSTRFGKADTAPRKLAIVIDRSGSMSGEPMTQAKRAVEACLGALAQDDEFALVAFDDRVDTFRNSLTKASMDRRSEAKSFLAGVDARGGTELASGFAAGAKMARGGDVLVITDGQVMGTDEILKKARELKVRIHCLGIGSASQDRFLSLLASSTGGVSRFVTPRERVDVAAVDLFASIGRPVASDVSVSGGVFAIPPSPFVFGGTPWVVFGEAVPGSAISVKWSGGKFAESVDGSNEGLDKSQTGMNDTVRLLDGARQITDFESRMAAGSAGEMDAPLVALSEKFGLASRAMALVCVVKREADVAGAPPVTQVVPLGMPQDTQYDAYFGAVPCMAPPPPGGFAMSAPIAPAPAPAHAARGGALASKAAGLIGRLLAGGSRKPEPQAKKSAAFREPEMLCELSNSNYAPAPAQAAPAMERGLDETDRLMAIAASLLPDGGAPGKDADERALATACAVLAFAREGHTPDEGAFRAHVARMVSYLAGLSGLTPEHGAIVREVVAFAGSGRTPKLSHPQSWADIEAAIA